MKIGAYQFAVSVDMKKNLEVIKAAVRSAEDQGIEFLLFPECALTGYPPRDLPSSSDADFSFVESACAELKALSCETEVAFLVGSIAKEEGKIYNRAFGFFPGEKIFSYSKRALWGWDRDNFSEGNDPGIISYKGFKIGVRICFEIRFPEYFRELYKEQTDFDCVLFYDRSDVEDPGRYSMLKGHIQTRAVENVCTFLTSNTTAPYQTAPTAVFGRSGQVIAECTCGEEGFVSYELTKCEYDFGERGRKEISDRLTM
ncbi:MAG: carbon-nitrogen hydrolase family protein [Clostridiales bacterium]|nr:carbon-nitrogen hydrolase family protein [Clostridiales bacterium]